MKTEFIRYGLGQWRPLVGALQICGALGLIIGYYYALILSIFAAFGLSLLMILGFGVRLRIKDNALQSAPSLLFALLNAYIAIRLLNSI